MSLEGDFLKRVEEMQRDLAVQALVSPQQRDAFEYGRVSGIYAGLEKTRLLFVEFLEDRARAENEL